MDAQAITFDAGGTLIRPHPSVGEIYTEVLGGFGIEVDPREVEKDFRVAFKASSRRGSDNKINNDSERAFWQQVVKGCVGRYIPPDIFDKVFDELYDTFASASRWQLAADALPTLKELSTRGYRLAILSNADSRFRQVFKEMGLAGLVEAIFISGEIGWEKPDLRIFRHVEKTLNLSPPQILHIGDSPRHDAEGAANAGWQYRLLKHETSPGEYPSINTLTEILTLIPGSNHNVS